MTFFEVKYRKNGAS